MIEYASDWRAASACLDSDLDMFFPVAVGTAANSQVSRALRICQACPVTQQCLDFALRSGEKDGIWGGTTPEQRVRARRARNRRLTAGPWQEPAHVRAS
jgi:WhiB family redox-sensing transcriptional regulator